MHYRNLYLVVIDTPQNSRTGGTQGHVSSAIIIYYKGTCPVKELNDGDNRHLRSAPSFDGFNQFTAVDYKTANGFRGVLRGLALLCKTSLVPRAWASKKKERESRETTCRTCCTDLTLSRRAVLYSAAGWAWS
jgi:hypothetical protein